MHKDPRYVWLETLGTKPDKGKLAFSKKKKKKNHFSSLASIIHSRYSGVLLFISLIVLMFDLFQLLTIISSIDDLNYPEKTQTYYIANAPYVFSACWKVCP